MVVLLLLDWLLIFCTSRCVRGYLVPSYVSGDLLMEAQGKANETSSLTYIV